MLTSDGLAAMRQVVVGAAVHIIRLPRRVLIVLHCFLLDLVGVDNIIFAAANQPIMFLVLSVIYYKYRQNFVFSCSH